MVLGKEEMGDAPSLTSQDRPAQPPTPEEVCSFIAAYSTMIFGDREDRWPAWSAGEEAAERAAKLSANSTAKSAAN